MKTDYKEILGVKEAISQGYEYYGEPGHEFQTLQDLPDLSKEDIDKKDFVLFSKDTIGISVSKDNLIDAAIDEARSCIEFCDDTTNVDDIVRNAVNWDEIEEKINEALSVCNYHQLTDIKLIWP